MPRAAVASTTAFFVFLSPGAIVNLAVLILKLTVIATRIRAALPPGAEDEIVVIEHLPGRRVHLQDFFWTSVEDAPPWLDPDQLLTLYETHTIHHTATVYVPEDPRRREDDGEKTHIEPKQPIDCASCIDPTPTLLDVDQDIGVLIGDDPGPRYWLLTVLKAGEEVPPKVELRLARLYKAAFTRQQQKHLGLLGPEIHTRKSPKRQAPVDNRTSIEETSMELTSANETSSILSPPESTITQRPLPPNTGGLSLLHMRALRIAKSKRTLPILESEDFEELALKSIIPIDDTSISPNSNNTNNTGDEKANLKSAVDVGLVQVRMQNMTILNDGATKLIYTVHLGGKPVPAETAAKDMALLSAQEVALELGAPVIIQSEPYLKESRPLALSRKRDVWLLAGAAGAGFLLLAIIIITLLLLTKRKRAQSAVSAPPNRRILGKDEEYAPTTPGVDNTAYTSETEGRTEPTSGHRRALSRTPGSQDTLEADTRGEISSENELDNSEYRKGQLARPWDTREYGVDAAKRGLQAVSSSSNKQIPRTSTIDRPLSGDSVDSADILEEQQRTLSAMERSFGPKSNGEREIDNDGMGSPHSYLSMPSCKQFPNMRTVEPLSKVLEPGVVKHLDLELDSPEMNTKDYEHTRRNGETHFIRASSDTKDPGVLGPIVWDLKRKRAVEGEIARQHQQQSQSDAELGSGRLPYGAVGRARKRLNELLEDSFSLFGNREPRQQTLQQQQQRRLSYERRTQNDSQSQVHDGLARINENRGKSALVSHVTVSTIDDASRPRTSFTHNDPDGLLIPETGNMGPQPRGAWGSRPLSAGPFHRPSLPEVEVVRVLADSQLRPEDPSVPIISAIKKELGKFSY